MPQFAVNSQLATRNPEPAVLLSPQGRVGTPTGMTTGSTASSRRRPLKVGSGQLRMEQVRIEGQKDGQRKFFIFLTGRSAYYNSSEKFSEEAKRLGVSRKVPGFIAEPGDIILAAMAPHKLTKEPNFSFYPLIFGFGRVTGYAIHPRNHAAKTALARAIKECEESGIVTTEVTDETVYRECGYYTGLRPALRGWKLEERQIKDWVKTIRGRFAPLRKVITLAQMAVNRLPTMVERKVAWSKIMHKHLSLRIPVYKLEVFIKDGEPETIEDYVAVMEAVADAEEKEGLERLWGKVWKTIAEVDARQCIVKVEPTKITFVLKGKRLEKHIKVDLGEG